MQIAVEIPTRTAEALGSPVAGGIPAPMPLAGPSPGTPPMASAFRILDLPPCVLTHLASTLSMEEQAQLACAASPFKAAVEAALARRTSWSWPGSRGPADTLAAATLSYLAHHCPRLRHVAVIFEAGDPTGAPSTATASTDSGDSSGDAPAAQVPRSIPGLAAACRTLQAVTLVNVGVDDDAVSALGTHCAALRHLAVGSTEAARTDCLVSDSALRAIALGCHLLQSLTLLRCPGVTDAGLDAFDRSHTLRALTVHNCPGVTAAGLGRFVIAHAARLRLLDVSAVDSRGTDDQSGSCLTPDAAAAIAASCHALQTLRISEEHLSAPAIDDGALSAIARGCPALSELDLCQVTAGDAALAAFADAGALRALRLDRTLAGDVGLARVAVGCSALRDLRVVGLSPHVWASATDRGVPGLSESGLRAVTAAATALTTLELSALAADPAAATDTPQETPTSSLDGGGGGGYVAGYDSDEDTGLGDGSGFDALNPTGASSRSRRHSTTAVTTAATTTAVLPLPTLLMPPAACRTLRVLSMDWVMVEPARLQAPLVMALRECGALRRLSLAGYQGDVAELITAVASASPPLTALWLQHSRASDAALIAASDAFTPTLSDVRLSYCRAVTDAGLDAVARLPQLTLIDLYQAPLVTPSRVADLIGTHPTLQALHIGHHTGSCAHGGRGGHHHRLGWAGSRGPGAGAHLDCVRDAAAKRGGRRRVMMWAAGGAGGVFEARAITRAAAS